MSLPLVTDQLFIIFFLIATLILIYFYRSQLLFHLRIRPYTTKKEDERQQSTKESLVKECPECEGKMEEGYLIGPQGIYWSTDVPLYGFIDPSLGVFGAEPIGFPYQIRSGIRTKYLKAYLCKRCHILDIRLDEQQPFGF